MFSLFVFLMSYFLTLATRQHNVFLFLQMPRIWNAAFFFLFQSLILSRTQVLSLNVPGYLIVHNDANAESDHCINMHACIRTYL